MQKINAIFLTFLIGLFLLNTNIYADNLWGNDTKSPNIGTAGRDFAEHDLVTIHVDERSYAASSGDTVTDRRSRWEVALNEWIKFTTKNGGLNLKEADAAFNPGIDLDARFRRDNSAETKKSARINFKIMAEVVEILPNGNLVIEAKTTRKINRETEILSIRGVIRPEDVDVNNTVKSENIANLTLSYEGEGTVSDGQKPGILGWILDKLWPF